MSTFNDRDLGMSRDITRRDFVNGVGIAVGSALAAPTLLAAQHKLSSAASTAQYYPPARTGMRGSHEGSFEVAHAMRDGNTWADASNTLSLIHI